MAFGEGLSVFIGFKVRGPRGMLPWDKIECSGLQVWYFRHSGKRLAHHNTNVQTEINIARKKGDIASF